MSRTNLQKKLNYDFKNKKLLEQAMTHSSYTRENKLPRVACNERLEFLGDAFFDAIIGEELYNKLPKQKEGCLTKYRAMVVCENSLAEVAKSLDIGGELLLGRGEDISGGRERVSIIADAMEAVIGAVYLDAGYEKVRQFVLDFFGERIERAINGRIHSDYKSEFQEKMQSEGTVVIEYNLLKEEGPDHDKTFFVEVLANGSVCGKGKGKSKKEAEQKAAKEAILKGVKDVL